MADAPATVAPAAAAAAPAAAAAQDRKARAADANAAAASVSPASTVGTAASTPSLLLHVVSAASTPAAGTSNHDAPHDYLMDLCSRQQGTSSPLAGAASGAVCVRDLEDNRWCQQHAHVPGVVTCTRSSTEASAEKVGRHVRVPSIACNTGTGGCACIMVATAAAAAKETVARQVNLLEYLGPEAAPRAMAGGDPHVTFCSFEPRLYLADKYSNSKGDVAALKSDIRQSAADDDDDGDAKEGCRLNAASKSDGQYQRLEFQCRDGQEGEGEEGKKRKKCAVKFSLRFDNKKGRWFLRIGSGCPHHSAHRIPLSGTSSTERSRKRRRKAKEEAENRALDRVGISPETFQDDQTQQVIAAAALAASVPKSKASDDGTCYLCIPLGATKSDQTLELATCACDSFQSQHYWLGPAPKASSSEDVTSSTAISADNVDREDDDIEKTDDDTAPPDEVANIAEEPLNKSTRTQAKRPPFENGINRRTKRIDEVAAENFNSGLPFFDLLITKPSKALKDEDRPEAEFQEVAFSGYPPNSLPGSQTDVKRKLPLFRLRKGIIKAGKNVHGSIWMEEAESFFIKSSSKYHTLLLRDHTKVGDVSKSGICSIYFRPLENTRYWWLSYLTTVKESTTSRKGYGTTMMWRMINLARRGEGIDEIWLEVQPDLKGVQQMYQRLGFEAMNWNDLPVEVANYEMEFPDVADPHKTKKERVYKHWGEFVLMRLDLSIFPPQR